MSVRGVFVSASDTRKCDPGEVIFSEGETSAEMFGIVSGAVELRKGDVTVARLGEGDTFGEMGIIDHAPRSLTAVAVEPTEIAVINERTFLFLVQETPMFAIQVMKSLAARIRELDRPA
jgi:CRP-like cAMP-binding protein